jgi:2,3-bisphosphoglycerate-independent phosphoglycerate mutase
VGLTRIFQAIDDGSFYKNEKFLQAMAACKKNNSALHLMGLVSDGAVHSHQEHLYALLKLAKDQGLTEVYIHAISDGRDTEPKSAIQYFKDLENKIKEIGLGKIATISGRFYAMDRDQRWDRISKVYDAIVLGEGHYSEYPMAALAAMYDMDKTDEFIEPIVLCEGDQPMTKLKDDDAVIFFNYRADRAREISQALTQEDFDGFVRKEFPKLSSYICMMEYDKSLNLDVAFEAEYPKRIFPELIAEAGLKQLRIAETEKYAHVTFFFNGGQEAVFPGEERVLVPSPKEVATYDLKPEMSAKQVCEKVLEQIETGKQDVIILNFANPDMVGHTAIMPAVVKAVEVIDDCIGQISKAILDRSGTLVISADHGNCEMEADQDGNPHTAHTTNLVPFILASDKYKNAKLKDYGRLSDIAPTLLEILEIDQPIEMTGESLITE